MGDSLACPRPGVLLSDTYGFLLQRELSKVYLHSEVINLAKWSQSIIGVNDQLDVNLSKLKPDIVVIHVGLVDCWSRPHLNGNPQTTFEQFTDYYQKIINLIKKHEQTKLIIIGICPTSIRMDLKYPRTLQQINKYNRILMSGSNQQQIYYVDMEKVINEDNLNVYLLPDDQHLNKSGNELVYQLIMEILKKNFLRFNK